MGLVIEKRHRGTEREQASIAIRYGLYIALDLLDFINRSNVIGLHVSIDDFRRSLESIDEPRQTP